MKLVRVLQVLPQQQLLAAVHEHCQAHPPNHSLLVGALVLVLVPRPVHPLRLETSQRRAALASAQEAAFERSETWLVTLLQDEGAAAVEEEVTMTKMTTMMMTRRICLLAVSAQV